jgi:hypothetical protein
VIFLFVCERGACLDPVARGTGSPRQAVLSLRRFELIYARGAIFLMVPKSTVGEHHGMAAVVIETTMPERTDNDIEEIW